MIILNVIYTCKPGMRDTFVEEIKKHQIEERVAGEPGNLLYSFSVPIQEGNTDQVYLLERYTYEAAFAFHKEQAHFQKLQEIKALYVADTQIQIVKE